VSKTTTLATGQITTADALTVELVQPADTPAMIMLQWPLAATVVDPRRLPATCNAVMRVLAAAVAKLAEIRADER
jgi:hypothetical protein